MDTLHLDFHINFNNCCKRFSCLRAISDIQESHNYQHSSIIPWTSDVADMCENCLQKKTDEAKNQLWNLYFPFEKCQLKAQKFIQVDGK